VRVFFFTLKLVKHHRLVLIISAILVAGFLFVTCVDNGNKQTAPKIPGDSQAAAGNPQTTGNATKNPTAQTSPAQTMDTSSAGIPHPSDFAGSAVCANCHRGIYKSQIRTAHYLTSQPAGAKNITLSKDPADNRFYFDPELYIQVEKRADSFYQVEYAAGAQQQEARIDMAVGSGKRGQTFLYWYHNKLLQLPLTWFSQLHRWTNSPGFSNRVIFRRPATSRCLECHTTFVQRTSAEGIEPEDFAGSGIIYGVDCEKCHGPAARHVTFHQQNPADKVPHFIIDPKKFTRAQSLDLCRLCHGGRLTKTRPSFSFQPGDKLADFFRLDSVASSTTSAASSTRSAASSTQSAAATNRSSTGTPGSIPSVPDIDVHGNQYGKLAASKCFRNSSMTCLSCHNPHENETGKKELFSERCMTCHTQQHGNFCKELTVLGASIKKNCIDCHMPEQSSRSVMFLLQGETVPTPAFMRSHYITIYPEETKKYLQKTPARP
jgi:hypothetical protein